MESSRVISTELFPYESFGVRLEVKAENRICWFKDTVDLQKHLDRYKLDKKNLKIDYRDGEPVDTSKKRKGSVEQKPKPKSKGSSSTSKGRKPSVDSTRNTTRSTKRKK
jgi:hypothetical protein